MKNLIKKKKQDNSKFFQLLNKIGQIIPVFVPNTRVNFVCDTIFLIVLMYRVFATSIKPFFFAHDIQSSLVVTTDTLIYIVNAAFIFEVLINFNTGYCEEKTMTVNMDRKHIFNVYFKNGFKKDLLAQIPFLLYHFVDKNSSDTVILILYATELLILLKLQKNMHIFQRVERFITESQIMFDWFPLFKLLFNIIVWAHFFALFFHGIAIYQIEIQNDENNWLNNNNLQDTSWQHRYLMGFYWSLGVMVTIVWYLPDSQIEVVFMLLVILSATVVIGYSVTTIGTILQNIEEKNSKFKKEMQIINKFFIKYHVNISLRTRVEKYMEYIHEQEKDKNKEEDEFVINRLSGQLRNEIIRSLNESDKNNSFSILKEHFNSQTINELILHIKQVNYGKNEIIFQKHEKQEHNLYVIIKGQVQFFYEKQLIAKKKQEYDEEDYIGDEVDENGEKKNKKLIVNTQVFNEGQTFGEFSFFTGLPKEISAKCIQNCTLYYIESSKFINIVQRNPLELEKFCYIRDQMIESYHLRNTTNQQLKEIRFDLIQVVCVVCQKEGHLPDFCPDLHYIPDKQQVIKDQYIRRQFIRKRKKMNALMNFNDNNIKIEEEDSYISTSSQSDEVSVKQEFNLQIQKVQSTFEQKSQFNTPKTKRQSEQLDRNDNNSNIDLDQKQQEIFKLKSNANIQIQNSQKSIELGSQKDIDSNKNFQKTAQFTKYNDINSDSLLQNENNNTNYNNNVQNQNQIQKLSDFTLQGKNSNIKSIQNEQTIQQSQKSQFQDKNQINNNDNNSIMLQSLGETSYSQSLMMSQNFQLQQKFSQRKSSENKEQQKNDNDNDKDQIETNISKTSIIFDNNSNNNNIKNNNNDISNINQNNNNNNDVYNKNSDINFLNNNNKISPKAKQLNLKIDLNIDQSESIKDENGQNSNNQNDLLQNQKSQQKIQQMKSEEKLDKDDLISSEGDNDNDEFNIFQDLKMQKISSLKKIQIKSQLIQETDQGPKDTPINEKQQNKQNKIFKMHSNSSQSRKGQQQREYSQLQLLSPTKLKNKQEDLQESYDQEDKDKFNMINSQENKGIQKKKINRNINRRQSLRFGLDIGIQDPLLKKKMEERQLKQDIQTFPNLKRSQFSKNNVDQYQNQYQQQYQLSQQQPVIDILQNLQNILNFEIEKLQNSNSKKNNNNFEGLLTPQYQNQNQQQQQYQKNGFNFTTQNEMLSLLPPLPYLGGPSFANSPINKTPQVFSMHAGTPIKKNYLQHQNSQDSFLSQDDEEYLEKLNMDASVALKLSNQAYLEKIDENRIKKSNRRQSNRRQSVWSTILEGKMEKEIKSRTKEQIEEQKLTKSINSYKQLLLLQQQTNSFDSSNVNNRQYIQYAIQKELKNIQKNLLKLPSINKDTRSEILKLIDKKFQHVTPLNNTFQDINNLEDKSLQIFGRNFDSIKQCKIYYPHYNAQIIFQDLKLSKQQKKTFRQIFDIYSEDGIWIDKKTIKELMKNLNDKFLFLDQLFHKKYRNLINIQNQNQQQLSQSSQYDSDKSENTQSPQTNFQKYDYKGQISGNLYGSPQINLQRNISSTTSIYGSSPPLNIKSFKDNKQGKLLNSQFVTPQNFNDLQNKYKFGQRSQNPALKKKILKFNQNQRSFQQVMNKMKEQQKIEYECIFSLFGTDQYGRIRYQELVNVMKYFKDQKQATRKNSRKLSQLNKSNGSGKIHFDDVVEVFKIDDIEDCINYTDFFKLLMRVMDDLDQLKSPYNPIVSNSTPQFQQLSEKEIADFRYMFSLFDKNGDEKIEIKELQRVMKKSIGRLLTEDDVQHMIQQVIGFERRRNNQVDEKVIYFYEFVKMLSSDQGQPELTVNQTNEFRDCFNQVEDCQNEKISLNSFQRLICSPDFPKYNQIQLFTPEQAKQLTQRIKNDMILAISEIQENYQLELQSGLPNTSSNGNMILNHFNMQDPFDLKVDLDTYLQEIAKRIQKIEESETFRETFRILSSDGQYITGKDLKVKLKQIFNESYTDDQIQQILNEGGIYNQKITQGDNFMGKSIFNLNQNQSLSNSNKMKRSPTKINIRSESGQFIQKTNFQSLFQKNKSLNTPKQQYESQQEIQNNNSNQNLSQENIKSQNSENIQMASSNPIQNLDSKNNINTKNNSYQNSQKYNSKIKDSQISKGVQLQQQQQESQMYTSKSRNSIKRYSQPPVTNNFDDTIGYNKITEKQFIPFLL